MSCELILPLTPGDLSKQVALLESQAMPHLSGEGGCSAETGSVGLQQQMAQLQEQITQIGNEMAAKQDVEDLRIQQQQHGDLSQKVSESEVERERHAEAIAALEKKYAEQQNELRRHSETQRQQKADQRKHEKEISKLAKAVAPDSVGTGDGHCQAMLPSPTVQQGGVSVTVEQHVRVEQQVHLLTEQHSSSNDELSSEVRQLKAQLQQQQEEMQRLRRQQQDEGVCRTCICS